MRKPYLRAASAVLLLAVCAAAQDRAPSTPPQAAPAGVTAGPSDNYPPGPDSLPQSNVPHGKTFEFTLENSKVFPNTTRKISVYVPAEYTGTEPACVYVGLDGLGFNVPAVFDNLIAKHAMPVTIAIGVAPGSVASPIPAGSPRFDRSFEFDSMTGTLAGFLLTEVLPQVESHATPDGKPIRLSTRANDRAIGGASTGGIGAFNVAWQRPDAFRRVFSAIGTYVGMRGGETFNVLVRKSEPKPIRVFLQDGAYDEWPGGPEMGDWWMSNQTMERALTFAGYDVRHIWGSGTHNGAQATAVFPEAMQWLWRDWPKAVEAGTPGNPALQAVLSPSDTWRTEPVQCTGILRLIAGADGTVLYGAASGRLMELPQRAASPCDAKPVAAVSTPRGTAIAKEVPGGTELHLSGGKPRVIVLPNLLVHDLIVRENGDLYATATNQAGDGEVWLVPSGGDPERVANGLSKPTGLALSPDKAWLFVAQEDQRNGWSYRVRPDGTLDSGEPFYEFFTPSSLAGTQARSVAMDTDGRAYVATAEGVAIFDHNGRLTAILTPPGLRAPTSLCFGGPGLHDLYVSDGEHVFVRTLKAAGAPPRAPAAPVPNWGPG